MSNMAAPIVPTTEIQATCNNRQRDERVSGKKRHSPLSCQSHPYIFDMNKDEQSDRKS